MKNKAPSSRKDITIHSSAAEYLTFVAASGDAAESFEIRYEDENIWLTQKIMAELYGVSVPAINQHLKNIFNDGELSENAVIKKYLITAEDGKRYQTKHYNLQAIIAVGFKINNPRAVQFRKWAGQIVKDYTIQGWVMDKERLIKGHMFTDPGYRADGIFADETGLLVDEDGTNTFIFYISLNDFMGLGEPIARVESTIGSRKNKYDDGKHIYYVNAGVDDQSAVANLMNYFKLADPNDASHGELSDRVHLLKCEKEGEEPMCAVTQSFVDEGKIIGVVQYLRNRLHMNDEKIIEEIKAEFDLNDYQARTFVYPKETESA